MASSRMSKSENMILLLERVEAIEIKTNKPETPAQEEMRSSRGPKKYNQISN